MQVFCENIKSFANSDQAQAHDWDQTLTVLSTSPPRPNEDQSLIFKT